MTLLSAPTESARPRSTISAEAGLPLSGFVFLQPSTSFCGDPGGELRVLFFVSSSTCFRNCKNSLFKFSKSEPVPDSFGGCLAEVFAGKSHARSMCLAEALSR